MGTDKLREALTEFRGKLHLLRKVGVLSVRIDDLLPVVDAALAAESPAATPVDAVSHAVRRVLSHEQNAFCGARIEAFEAVANLREAFNEDVKQSHRRRILDERIAALRAEQAKVPAQASEPIGLLEAAEEALKVVGDWERWGTDGWQPRAVEAHKTLRAAIAAERARRSS